MKYRRIIPLILAGILAFSAAAAGCGGSSAAETAAVTSAAETTAAETASEETAEEPEETTEAAGGQEDETEEPELPAEETQAEEHKEAPEIPGLTWVSTMDTDYATCFDVYYYNDGYKLISVPLSGEYLIIPENGEVPEGIPDDYVIIHQPLTHIYLAAQSSMSFFIEMDKMDTVTMSGTTESGWVLEEPKKALQEGRMVYAGKYSEPDYELILGSGCDLALESTMIYHTPEVKEMLEDLGIPVFVDRCSYELAPLGRVEWIRLYGAMLNCEDVAEECFREQEAVVSTLMDHENTGKTVAFFAVNSTNQVSCRRTADFIPNMIEIAGGKYIFEDLKNATGNSATVSMSMETFYNAAIDCDYLVYNGTIESPLTSVDDLIAKDQLFANFKAVKEGNVWQVDKTWYQSTATVGYLITDFNIMMTGGDESQLHFLQKVPG